VAIQEADIVSGDDVLPGFETPVARQSVGHVRI
jgi:hypothetical protein